MCTVTYIPTSTGVLVTSNRDERMDRAPALPPAVYPEGHRSLTYPKDTQAGGTWIALGGGRSAAVLLNGGFANHARKTHYTKSRGLVMLEIVSAEVPLSRFRGMSLEAIEPFTLILFTDGELMRCTWDGMQKHISYPDPQKAHIWSSATLYGQEVRMEREGMLQNWLSHAPQLTTETVLGLHLSPALKYETSPAREHAHMRTVSVTSLELPTDGVASIRYHDLLHGKYDPDHETGKAAFQNPNSTLPDFDSFYWKARRAFIRLGHWEYWPMECVYLPLLPLWLWLSLRARSLLFFSAANPGIQYSGFIHERKSDIYPLLPPGLYPKTVLCPAGSTASAVASMLAEHCLAFPLIAKPDIGERGVQVKLLKSAQDLEAYRLASRVDFLLQHYVDYENEAGIFYYRIPGSAHGHVSGIVGKEFLRVTGDGRSTTLSLLTQNNRAILQLPALAKAYGDELIAIPPAGECLTLVPYGNHSRGAKFIDLADRITPALTAAIDEVCQRIPGFDFGRLDIRFKSWEDLEAGSNFSIIELNGTGSEPTHIYDPSHSLLFAWKEIYRHWKVLFHISLQNVRNGRQRLMTWREGRRMRYEHRKHFERLKMH
jgi:hypothetical protein